MTCFTYLRYSRRLAPKKIHFLNEGQLSNSDRTHTFRSSSCHEKRNTLFSLKLVTIFALQCNKTCSTFPYKYSSFSKFISGIVFSNYCSVTQHHRTRPVCIYYHTALASMHKQFVMVNVAESKCATREEICIKQFYTILSRAVSFFLSSTYGFTSPYTSFAYKLTHIVSFWWKIVLWRIG